MAKQSKIIEAEESMRGEYPIARGWKIFLWIASPAMMAGGGWLCWMAWDKNSLTFDDIGLAVAGLFLLLLGLLGILSLRKERFIIERNSITEVDLFHTRTLLLTDIKGVRIKEKKLLFVAKDPKQKDVSIGSHSQDYDLVTGWALSLFTDLDRMEELKEQRETLHNPRYGRTPREVSQKMERYRRWTRPLSALAWVATALFFFWPDLLYRPLFVVCGLLPIVGIALHVVSKGLLPYATSDRSTTPSVESITFLPLCALGIRALIDYDILDFSHFWQPFAIGSALLLLFLIITECLLTHDKEDLLTVFFLALIFAPAYTASTLVISNELLDHATPTTYRTHVLNKWETSGKHHGYKLSLAPWPTITEPQETEVSRRQYKQVATGDTINVDCYPGTFHIPYFYVDIP